MARLRLQGVPESAVAEQVADVLRRVSLPQVRLRPFTRAAHVALPLTAPCAPRVPAPMHPLHVLPGAHASRGCACTARARAGRAAAARAG